MECTRCGMESVMGFAVCAVLGMMGEYQSCTLVDSPTTLLASDLAHLDAAPARAAIELDAAIARGAILLANEAKQAVQFDPSSRVENDDVPDENGWVGIWGL